MSLRQRTLGLACTHCKFAMHFFTARKETLELLDGKYFAFCPLCGKKAHTLDNILDVNMWESAFKWNMPIETYRQLHELYNDYIRTRNEVGTPLTFGKWLAKMLQETVANA